MPHYEDDYRAKVVAALTAARGVNVGEIARAYGVAHSTVLRWARQARVKIAPARQRLVEAGRAAARRKWGDWEARRGQARKLRKQGKTLREIAAAVGYRSIAGASYGSRRHR